MKTTTRTLCIGSATAVLVSAVILASQLVSGTGLTLASSVKPDKPSASIPASSATLTEQQRELLLPAINELNSRFSGASLRSVSVYFSLDAIAWSPITVTDSDGTTYRWSQHEATFVEEGSDVNEQPFGAEQPFTPEQVSWDAVLDMVNRSGVLFNDSTLVVGSLFVSSGVGDAVATVDAAFTSEAPELKPSLTMTLDGRLIGVRCPAAQGCDWLHAAA